MRITCSRWGTKFSAFDIDRLHSECRAWIDFNEFHCFTDQPEPLHSDIIVHKIPKDEAYSSWWSKLLQFKTFTEGKTLSLDVDLHIRDRCEFQFSKDYLLAQLDPLADYIPSKKVKYINSSFVTYEGDFTWIHDKYIADWKHIQQRYRGDQEFMWGMFAENFKYHKPMFESYKWSAKQKGHSHMPIVNYHGEDAKRDL